MCDTTQLLGGEREGRKTGKESPEERLPRKTGGKGEKRIETLRGGKKKKIVTGLDSLGVSRKANQKSKQGAKEKICKIKKNLFEKNMPRHGKQWGKKVDKGGIRKGGEKGGGGGEPKRKTAKTQDQRENEKNKKLEREKESFQMVKAKEYIELATKKERERCPGLRPGMKKK